MLIDLQESNVHKLPHFQICVTITHTLALIAAQNYLTCVEIHGESSKAYRTKLSPLEQKILMNRCNCMDVIDFCTPGDRYVTCVMFIAPQKCCGTGN